MNNNISSPNEEGQNTRDHHERGTVFGAISEVGLAFLALVLDVNHIVDDCRHLYVVNRAHIILPLAQYEGYLPAAAIFRHPYVL